MRLRYWVACGVAALLFLPIIRWFGKLIEWCYEFGREI